MANYSKLLSLIGGADRTVDFSLNSNILELGGGGLQLNGSTSGHIVQSASATTTTYSIVWPAAQAASPGFVLANDGTGILSWVSASSGSVTSVALALPVSVFSVSGSPVTSSGTLTGSFVNQSANMVFAGPTSGGAAAPTFRSLVAADIPSLAYANQALSNLSGVAINASLLPGADNSINLGSAAKSWAAANIHALNDASSAISIDVYNRALEDSAAATQLSWSTSGVEFNQLTASTVPYLNAGKILTSSAVTPTELGYVSGVTSAIQTQLNAKQSSTLTQNHILVGNASNLATDVAMSGEASIVASGAVTLSNAAVIAKVLTGYVAGAGTVTSADSILSALEKLDGNDANYLPLAGGTMSGAINMGSNKITSLAAGTISTDAVNYGQVILASGANAFTGNQPMGSHKLTGLSAGTTAGDSVRYEQAVLTNGTNPITGDQSFSGTAKITNLVDPTLAQDGATKSYVDNAVAGLSWKQAGRVASVANVSVASAPAAIDGVTLVSGNRILLKDQTAPAENGIYIFNGTGSALTRSSDADTWNEIVGLVIYIEEGTVNTGSKWVNTNVAGGTLGTTAITFTIFAAASALDGVGTAGYSAYWTGSHTLAAEQFVSAVRGGLATDASAFTGLVKASAGVFSASALVNSDVAAGAAIAYSKLALTNSIVNADINSAAAIAYSKLNLSASIVNADIAAGAAIAYSKLNLSASIVNADIAAGAAIAYSKLALTNSIVLGDLTSNSVDENKIVSTTFSTTGALNGGSGTKVSVRVDNSTIDINGSNNLEVKALGITSAQLAAASVTAAKLATVTDGLTLDQSGSGSTIEIKAAGVSATQLATGAFDQVTITGGAGTAASVASSPAIKESLVAGEAFAATTLFAVRFAKAADAGFVAGRVYKADNNTTSADNFYVIGLVYSAGSVSTGGAITATKLGLINVPSHGFTVGQPLYLGSSGAITATAPSTTLLAVERVGIVRDANNIEVQIDQIGIN